ncbi:glycoside hydrolase family 28 protein [Trematosphaeria pertusa]|uniref:galacturonan 1,4-alpha-galacturonidase n=1 Tax=Trematosphaeria pertusa TaxID=390896 RepID=A0A6A6HXF6_9PLEO|nr:glycoside hydrolase family 28 protein [Trematosphaeria pertusa]KAF2242895.1 glycoside hydrolase family 28 protein [Trematosphaeria pertusa]
MTKEGSLCTVTPNGGGKDDAISIMDAFKQCGKNGQIEITEGDFTIAKVMDYLNLENCDISIKGKLTWSTDMNYWKGACMGVTYAQRCTAFRLGGTNFNVRGHGKALFHGNGQTWIDANRNGSNMQGRPINFTLWKAKNVLVDGITWRQSQFWHTFVAHSENITMTNLDMNTTSNSQWNTVNTDGTDTWNTKGVTIKNWVVTCGDDCISMKGNSSDVYVKNVTCYESGAMVIGSLGNPASTPDYVENVVFEDITAIHSSNAAWIKTYPGTGYVRNITFRNINFQDVNQPIYVTPCIYTWQNCDSSRLKISDVTWENITGTSRYNVGAGLYCSRNIPCTGFKFKNIDIKPKNGGSIKYLCSNINSDNGLGCTGTCPAGWKQQLSGNA